MTRRVIALLALAGAAAAPAAADARPPQAAKFIAHVSAKQKIYWEVPRFNLGSSCQGQQWTQAGGFENVTFRSRKPLRVLVYRLPNGAGPFVRYGRWRVDAENKVPGFPVSGTLERFGRKVYGIDPDPRCFDPGDPTEEDTGPYDCGERKFDTWAWLRLTRDSAEVDANTLLDEPYENCPITAPDGIDAGAFNATASNQRGLLGDLFDREQGLIVLKGHRTARNEIVAGKGFAEATVEWTVRLRRVR